MGVFTRHVISAGSKFSNAFRTIHFPHFRPSCSTTRNEGSISLANRRTSGSKNGIFAVIPSDWPMGIAEKLITFQSFSREDFRALASKLKRSEEHTSEL